MPIDRECAEEKDMGWKPPEQTWWRGYDSRNTPLMPGPIPTPSKRQPHIRNTDTREVSRSDWDREKAAQTRLKSIGGGRIERSE